MKDRDVENLLFKSSASSNRFDFGLASWCGSIFAEGSFGKEAGGVTFCNSLSTGVTACGAAGTFGAGIVSAAKG